ncbi:tol-pal system protein YbgF [Parachitinimonas caeni]|uniref:Cell division coordinator CpoB n=1 Tax=Parachitinimonas caeni TaxID=3031301 RepID=A0ABT7DTP2_9NEIS|nr:tol-pal system protein YbgF [Parachitinimonas caeni]MDK2122515.1 tol-pal system protein YbgF [Parachitinimonas caeni]
MRLRCLSALLLVLALPAKAGLFDDDEARKQVAELRVRLETLNNTVSDRLNKVETQLQNQKLLELVNQIEGLNGELAKLRGQIEVLTFNIDNLQKRQKDLYVDLDSRLRQLETPPAQTNPQPGATQSTGAVDTPTTSEPAHGEGDASAYEAAYNLYRVGNYKNAVSAFDAFLKSYRDSRLVPNALFWQGLSYAQQRDYKSAMLALRKVVDNWPDHQKTPDAMRAIANLQIEAGDAKAARKTLKDLITNYPGSEAAQRAKRQLEML